MKKLSIIKLTTKLLSIFQMDPYIKITKKFAKKFGSKVIDRQYFDRKTRLRTLISLCSHFNNYQVIKRNSKYVLSYIKGK